MDKKQTAKLAVCILVVALFLGSWCATQSVAKKVEYDKVIGEPLFFYKTMPVYAPYKFFVWKHQYGDTIPKIFTNAQRWIVLSITLGFAAVFFTANKKVLSSHGTAKWAKKEDIKAMGFLKDSNGVVLGRNPYGKELLYHTGAEHILLMAPTRSGKGVGVIIPTCLQWKHSMIVTDVKSENWEFTAGYRKRCLGNKVLKFAPMDTTGSGVKYNPLTEMRFRSIYEVGDIMNLADMLVDPEGKGTDHWGKTGHTLLVGTILHLLYAHHREDRLTPNMSDLVTFLSSPGQAFEDRLEAMGKYPHITPEEFFSDDNVLEKVYGEYIRDFSPYYDEGETKIQNLKELKEKLRQSDEVIDFEEEKYAVLLTNPKVAETAAEMLNKAPNEFSSIHSTALSFLGLYRDPIITENICRSEFSIMDLVDENQAVSLYLCIPPGHLNRLRPLIRLILNITLRRLTEEETDFNRKRKQRLLLLLDEFPQFGKMETMETALAVMAGYNMKALVVCQDKNQLDKAYTKENSIISNCHVRIFYTPNETESAAFISKMLGKETIMVSSTSSNGGFMKKSTSKSEIGRELMTPDEVGVMPNDKELIFIAGKKPILANKVFYYQDDYLSLCTRIKAPAQSDICRKLTKEE